MRFGRSVKIYLDDDRLTPDGWLRAYSYDDAIALLRKYRGRVSHMSFDHDLGALDVLNGLDALGYDSLAPTGYDVLCWIEHRLVHTGDKKIVPKVMSIHSANPVGRANMQRAIDAINRFRA
jgi:hypothetical protein